MITKPYWGTTASLPTFQSLDRDLQADVVVIGAGLTGITTAYLLKRGGAKVVLLDRQRCAGADTGHTTAHLTYVTDKLLHELVNDWGKDAARSFWEAGSAAIDQIFDNARVERIDCELKWVPGYLHARLEREHADDRETLEKDFQLARELGFKAENSFDEIVRIHIEEDRGGTFVN